MRRVILLLPVLLLACTRNLPPLLDEFNVSSTTVQPCQSLNLTVMARDPENAGLKYTFEASPNTGTFDTFGATTTWLQTPTTTQANQSVVFTVRISDGQNVVQSNPIKVNLLPDTKAKNCSSISGVVRPGVQFASLRGYENAEMRLGEAIVQFKNPSNALRLQSADLAVQTWITGNTAVLEAPKLKAQARLQSANARVQGTNALETMQFVSSLRQRPDVLSAEPNTILKTQAVPNDPLYAKQWHYNMLNLPATWDGFSSENEIGAGIVVGIIDSGILWDATDPAKQHPDFNCEVAPGKPKILPGYDFVQNDNNAFDSDPNAGFHGTHVAGTVGACSNNALGVTGVAWKTQILPIRALDGSGGSIEDIARAVYWAAGISSSSLGVIPNNPNPAHVINMSLGGEQSPSPVLQAAVNAANAKGVVVVVAAGNGDFSTGKPLDAAVFTPANLQGVIPVGALAPDKARASYSNYGSTVALVAPGGDFDQRSVVDDGVLSVLGCGAGDLGQFNNPQGGTTPPCGSNNWGYGSYHGTSMASPHVAGVVALMMSKNAALRGTDPNNWVRIRSYLTDSSSVTGLSRCLQGCGAGLLDAGKAVQAATNLPSIGAVIVNANATEINLGSSQNQRTFTIQNVGDTPTNLNISAAGNGLSVTPSTVTLNPNQTQVITVNLNRAGLAGDNAGRINIQYGTRNFEQRVYYNQGLGVLSNPMGHYLRIYRITGVLPNGDKDRQRLNYPDTPIGANGIFAFDNLEPGEYDITAYRESSLNPDGTINVSDLGESRGLFTFDAPVTTEVTLENLTQIICSRTGTVAGGPTKCPGK
jgi:subtilisin family serine protease